MTRPYFRSNRTDPGRWFEVPVPDRLNHLINPANSYLRTYRLGPCTVIVTREYDRWHMSIAHPDRYPSWDEIATARYKGIPDNVWMALALPPGQDYVSLHPNCFQLIQIAPDVEALPAEEERP